MFTVFSIVLYNQNYKMMMMMMMMIMMMMVLMMMMIMMMLIDGVTQQFILNTYCLSHHQSTSTSTSTSSSSQPYLGWFFPLGF